MFEMQYGIRIILGLGIAILIIALYFFVFTKEKDKEKIDDISLNTDYQQIHYQTYQNNPNELRHRQFSHYEVGLPRPFVNESQIAEDSSSNICFKNSLHSFPAYNPNIVKYDSSDLTRINTQYQMLQPSAKQAISNKLYLEEKIHNPKEIIRKVEDKIGLKFTPPLVQVTSLVDRHPPPRHLPGEVKIENVNNQETKEEDLRLNNRVPSPLNTSQPPPPPPAVGGLTETTALTISTVPARSFPDTPVYRIPFDSIALQGVIGGGAFGQVWRATWRGTPVAVKLLSSVCQNQSATSALQTFDDEVFMLATLRHPNICMFLGACTESPNRAIVTELVSRGSLWDALRNASLFPEKADTEVFFWPWWVMKRVLDGTCRGLAYLHANAPPVLHRDLKSANLLLDDSFNVKICDFGLARLRDLTVNMTANVGTAQWTAPEVLSGLPYGESADMYSVGVILWEMMTGKCPYESMQSHIQIVFHVVHSKGRPIIPLNCPARVRQFVESCWADDPTRRLRAADALVKLESF